MSRERLANIQSRMVDIHEEIESIGQVATDEGRDLTDDEKQRIDKLSAEFNAKETDKASAEKAIEVQDKLKAQRLTQQTLNSGSLIASPPPDPNRGLPARVKSYRSKVYDNTADAFLCGQFMRAVLGSDEAANYCRNQGLSFRNALEGGTDTLGGYAVPEEMQATIIRLVEEYGVYRRSARTAVMSTATLDVPARTDGLTVYYPGEGQAITASDLTFGQVNLIAKKAAQLQIMSTEVAEDAIISMIDLVTTEIAWNFAKAEDTNAFLGDGSATYGGITGIKSALLAGSRVTAGGTTLAAITMDDLNQMVAKCKLYGRQLQWYMNSYTYHAVVLPLLQALGGTDMRQVEEGGRMMLLGYPVVYTQVLVGSTAAASAMPIVFGDLDSGAYFGDRRSVTIRTLNELYAANDQIGVIATERYDAVIHDVGAADDSGCIIALDLAAV